MGRGRGRRDNELIGQTVRISQGPYKGEPVTEEAAARRQLSASKPSRPSSHSQAERGRSSVAASTDSSQTALMNLPTFSRLHWRGEGRDGVYSQSRAALHLSDHLCGQTAPDHHVCSQNPRVLSVSLRLTNSF